MIVDMNKNQKGFSIVEGLLILIIIGLIGGTGWYVWHSKQTADKTYSTVATTSSSVASTETQKKTDNYSGWSTCSDKADGVSFRYPSDWTANGTPSSSDPCQNFSLTSDGQELVLRSPTKNNLSFIIFYFPASKPRSNTLSPGADVQEVQAVTPFVVNNGKTKVNLVSYRDQSSTTDSNMISDMGLSSQQYIIGQTFSSFNGVTSPSNSNYQFNMFASLAIPNSQYVQSHTPAEYQSQPSYADLMNIFKSVTYE